MTEPASRRGCLSSLSISRSRVKADTREAQVYFSHRGVFMPDHDLVGCPGKQLSMDGVAVIIRRHTDPIAAPKPDVLGFGPPIVGLARLVGPRGLDRVVGRHVRESAVTD